MYVYSLLTAANYPSAEVAMKDLIEVWEFHPLGPRFAVNSNGVYAAVVWVDFGQTWKINVMKRH